MDQDSGELLGEERRRRVKKKRRVTRTTVGGKEVKGDFLKNPSTLEFPDPMRKHCKWIVAAIILVVMGLSALLIIKVADMAPTNWNTPEADK